MVVIGLVIGVALGVLIGFLIGKQRSAAAPDTAAEVLRVQLASANELRAKAEAALETERERADRERRELMENLDKTFESTSQRVLDRTVDRFSKQQEDLAGARDETLATRLEPIKEILGQYQEKLRTYDEGHQKALHEVKSQADRLLEAQVAAQQATNRLNTLLGRSDSRGRWGEVQLANVLAASDLQEGIDFELQSSGTADSGQRQRPDCVLHLPNGTKIVIDAKFPFDAFEASMSASDPEEIKRLRDEHAKALRQHVKTLGTKSYWESLNYTPRFTVCFVPSDAALSTAFDADPELYDFATKQNVLIAGPTNLLALLWSAKMVLQEFQQMVNAEQILLTAAKLPDLIANVASPIEAMGKALVAATTQYNKVVSSVQSRLVPAARRMQQLGVGMGSKPIPELDALEPAVSALDHQKWGVDPNDSNLVLRSEVLDLDEIVEPGFDEGDELTL